MYIAFFIDALGSGLFAPFALLYFTKITGQSVSTIGATLTVATVVSLSATWVAGSLLDHVSAGRLVGATQWLQAVGCLFYLAVDDSVQLFGAALVVAVGNRAFYVASGTLIAERVTGEARASAFGYLGAVQNLAWGLSAVVVGILLTTNSLAVYRAVILANVGCFVVAGVLTRGYGVPSRKVDRPREVNASYRAVIANRSFLGFAVGNSVFAVCAMILNAGIAVYVTRALSAPIWLVGVVGFLNTGIVVVIQFTVMKHVERFSRMNVLVVSGLIWSVSFAALAVARVVPSQLIVIWLILAVAIFALAQGLYVPVSRAVAVDFGSSAMQGRYMAGFELSCGVGAAMTPAFFGLLFDVRAPLPWIALAGGSLVGCLVLHSVGRAMTRT